MRITSIVKVLLLITFLKGLVWSTFIPLWQFPDEQAHFAQVQNYVEWKSLSSKEKDLSEEIYESERVLGTLRDEFGNNKFTYNPTYRIDYSDTKVGLEEDYLATLPLASRVKLVKQEAPKYPPLFYLLSSIGYLSAYRQSLFSRVVITRLVSVLMLVGMVYFSFKFGEMLFFKDKYLAVAVAVAVAFQPMLTFVSSGINNDTLINLIATILLYLLMKAMRFGITMKDSFLMGITLALGTLTKQLIYLLIPVMVLVFVYGLLKSKLKGRQMLKIGLAVLAGSSLMLLLLLRTGFWWPFWPQVTSASAGYHLSNLSLIVERMQQLYRETLPWYWGVFKWLGVVLPLNLIRLIKVVMFLSLVGWGKYIYHKIKIREIELIDHQLLVLILANLIYIVVLVIWDIALTRQMGWAHGIQGRYFFPLIASQMVLLIFGLWQLVKNLVKPVCFTLVLVLVLVLLNFLALHRVVTSYYDLVPISVFINQVSQYKPQFAKWPYLGVYLLAYLWSILVLIRKLVPRKS